MSRSASRNSDSTRLWACAATAADRPLRIAFLTEPPPPRPQPLYRPRPPVPAARADFSAHATAPSRALPSPLQPLAQRYREKNQTALRRRGERGTIARSSPASSAQPAVKGAPEEEVSRDLGSATARSPPPRRAAAAGSPQAIPRGFPHWGKGGGTARRSREITTAPPPPPPSPFVQRARESAPARAGLRCL